MALKRNQGPLRDEEIARLFREIMSACLAQQEPLKVAFLGPEGTFTQAAVLKHFGSSVRALPLAGDRRGIPRSRGRYRRLRRGAHRKFQRGHGQSHPGYVSVVRAQDLRRSGAADQSSLDGQDERHRSRQARVRAPAGPGAMPRLAGRAASRRGAGRRFQQRRGRAARARRARHRGDRQPGGRGDLRAQRARQRDRGPAGQHHPIPGGGQKTIQRERRRPHHAAGIGRRHRRCRCTVPPARAAVASIGSI